MSNVVAALVPNAESNKEALAAASASTTRCVLVIVIWSFFGV